MTPAQSRAARGLLNWSEDELASASQVSPDITREFESGKTAAPEAALSALRRAFEKAGVVFVEENSEDAGVRLAHAHRAPISDEAALPEMSNDEAKDYDGSAM